MIFTAFQFYFWFWYKDKWKRFIKEFDKTSLKKAKTHLIYLLIYLVICLMPIVVGAAYLWSSKSN